MSLRQIDEKVTVPMRIIIPVISSLIAATAIVCSYVNQTRSEIAQLRADIQRSNTEFWTTRNMQAYAAKTKEHNVFAPSFEEIQVIAQDRPFGIK